MVREIINRDLQVRINGRDQGRMEGRRLQAVETRPGVKDSGGGVISSFKFERQDRVIEMPEVEMRDDPII